MLTLLWNLFFFILALGLLITIHEYGHFWVARRCGVKVERFSIGFGPALLRRVGRDGTEYVLAAIPLGGYVKMLDERVAEVAPEDRHLAFNNKSLKARTAIVAAGPAANILFAILVYWLMWMVGVPAIKPVVGAVAPQSIAAEAKLPLGEIFSIDDQQTRSWEEVNLALVAHIGEPSIALQVKDNDGLIHDVRFDTRQWQFNPDQQSSLTSLGIVPFRPRFDLVVDKLKAGDAAERAGLKPGDKLLALADGQTLDWDGFVKAVQQSPNKPLEFLIERDGERMTLTVVPDERDGQGYVGLYPVAPSWPEGMLTEIRFGPLDALQEGVKRTWQMVSLTGSTLAKLVTGDLALDNLSGPIAIAQGAGASAGIGFAYFLGFLGLISVNLGIINLLPLPVLDGGHLLFFLCEAVRGKPLSERAQDVAFRLGAALLLTLMGIAIFNDLARL
ncbi:sigma E protease regulator RseP [Gallaecimonas xiamenensis]|uniref:Zinc metalloprotease n=1 Tax=Gallaecimonas xiamenensis 3-C-1 TaxID=745411 RepID=K2J2D4_9GAMM|nr:sigma E protease regulator RseP [Gallaecimonas xiamenensis]EKE69208.1 membrane-associated zinc metalloprotease EcfE [Gallaecimonas xiamenensis 3-C-1]